MVLTHAKDFCEKMALICHTRAHTHTHMYIARILQQVLAGSQNTKGFLKFSTFISDLLPNLAKSSCECSHLCSDSKEASNWHKGHSKMLFYTNWWTIHNQGFYFYFYFSLLWYKKFGGFFPPKKLQKIVEIKLGKFFILFFLKRKISQPFRFKKRPVFFFGKVALSTSSVSLWASCFFPLQFCNVAQVMIIHKMIQSNLAI